MSKIFHGKAIYNPSGKAGEYSYWAANFYNGCSAKCDYCYNRHGRSAKVVGRDVSTLKKSLIDEDNALHIFKKEAMQNRDELQKHGLFFNFVSDPCLHQTIDLNYRAILHCETHNIPVKILTKQTWWLSEIKDIGFLPNNVAYGFTLTGHDELEPGAATNAERIEAMKKLHDAGFKTWASIEPIIDLDSSYDMIIKTIEFCDFYKIGLQSGKKYSFNKLHTFTSNCLRMLCYAYEKKVYFKDSLLKKLDINRDTLPSNCVTRDFNL
jgi:DNA repair photolyase